VTHKTGFGFNDRIYWTFIQLVPKSHKSLSTGHSHDHTTLIHYSWSLSHSLLYSLGSDLTENTSTIAMYCCKHYLATVCLPRICLRGICLSSRCLPMDLYVTLYLQHVTKCISSNGLTGASPAKAIRAW
jgi:hypothetical protein